MEKMKPTKESNQKPLKKNSIDPVFLKKIEHLKEEEQRVMLKLYSEIVKEIKV
ncbi:hypothetical protein MNB_SV-12-934 [hydrothermal vent metagenome]|uniref:Uncharacterized protein n=1 Tax=hydrothermal vent metagenome TaxID=652676 RepID=A0A1W1C784_9ZZZZ